MRLPPDPERNAAILSAALLEFSLHGYAATSLSSIARRAGVSRSRVRRVFPNKEEAFREVIRTTVLQTHARDPISSPTFALGVEEDASAAVRRITRAYWHAMRAPELAGILRLTMGELLRFPELAVLHTTQSLERMLHMLERIVVEGVRRGELRTPDPRGTARALLAVLVAHALWFAHPDVYAGVTGANREQSAEATIEVLLRMLYV